MGKHKIIKSAAAVALTASVVATAAPGASAASYKTNAKDQLVHTSTGKLVKGWKVFGGKLYKNGKLAPAKKYKIIGTGAAQKLFYGPTLKKGYKTANSKTLLFKDGKLADGWKQAGKNERLYKNGKLDKGYTVFTNVEGDKFLYQNGKLKKGQKTANRGGETLLFVDGKLAKGYVLHEASKTLFNNGKVAEGLVKYPETDGKFYNDGKLANGEINGAEYKDGVLVAKDVASVKAINDTTVEVTFKEAQKAENIKAADFKIEGLTVSNAALKQTDSKVVVLTTSKQEAAKEYVITYKENDTKTFVGFNAAIPTAIKSTEVKPYQTSQQAKIGEQVTVKATVTVAEGANKAGIPVTFVVDNNKDTASGNNANQGKDQTVEVLTDENGVAYYTYTQYAASTDTVTAYPTGAPTQRTTTNVFWGVAQPLAVTEATEGSVLANDGKKVYKVSAPEYKGKTVNVTFAENFNVTPDKVDYKAKINGVTPFQTQIAGKADAAKPVTVTLDSNGEATFTVTGANTTVTPVVFFDDVKTNVDGLNRLNKTELQATAASVKFDNIKTVSLTNEAKGTSKASVSTKAVATDAKFSENVGGREFVATYTDENGKLAPKGATVYVTFAEKESDKEAKLQGALRVFGENGAQATVAFKDSVTGNNVYKLTVGDNGQVKYTVSSTVENNYATPITFLDNGSNKTNNTLDQYDTQAKAETTYFGDATVKTAVATYYHDKALTKPVDLAKDKIVPGTPVYVEYQTVDQNGLPYAPQDEKGNVKLVDVKFQFTTTFGNLTVKDAATGKTLGTVTGNTNNNEFVVSTDADGEAVLELNTDLATTIKIQASGTPTIENTKVEDFTNYTGVASTAKTLAQTTADVNKAAATVAAVQAALEGYPEYDKLNATQKTAVATAVKAIADGRQVLESDITKAIADATATNASKGIITEASLSADGKTLTVTFDKELKASSVTIADFKVAVDGTTFSSPDSVTVSGKKAILTFNSALAPSNTASENLVKVNLADDVEFTDGSTNADTTAKQFTQEKAPAQAKVSALTTTPGKDSTPVITEVLSTGDVTVDTVKVTAAVKTTKAQADYNGLKIKFAKKQTAGTPTATIDTATGTVTVELSISDANNTAANINTVINGLGIVTVNGKSLDLTAAGLEVNIATPATTINQDKFDGKVITLANGVTANATVIPGEYKFTLNDNLSVGDVITLNGIQYVAGTDFIVKSTAALTATELAAAINAKDLRFATTGAVAASGVITLTEATTQVKGQAAPTLTYVAK